jgi:pimeloyl-ACP methyl ester carboxylesterase
MSSLSKKALAKHTNTAGPAAGTPGERRVPKAPRFPLRTLLVGTAVACSAAVATAAAPASPASVAFLETHSVSLTVTWLPSYHAPETPAKYDKVGVIKVGPRSAKNVLVLEPGTSAGSAYFVPLAKWIVAKTPGWQVWSVERRENLLEDQSELNLFKEGKTSATELYDYYLGYIKDPKITHHFQTIPTSTVEFAKNWGMNVAVQDLHTVIEAANKLGGKVVLGGHSLGGSVVTAYATWNFNGKPGAEQLAGLVYIDGASSPTPEARGPGGTPVPMTAAQASETLQAFDAPSTSPWLSFGGISAPYAGLFNASGSAAALLDPNAQSLGQSSGLLPADIVPPVTVSNVGQYGYALNVATSPLSLEAAQAHLGVGVSSTGPVHGWNGTGALTPIARFATMFSGVGITNADGTEWYFPQRLTDDSAAVADGNANPAQSVFGVRSTMGHDLPHRLLIYAFAAHLGGPGILAATKILAQQSGIPMSHLTLVDEHDAYAHNDPAGAYPKNVFYSHLVPFLEEVDRH